MYKFQIFNFYMQEQEFQIIKFHFFCTIKLFKWNSSKYYKISSFHGPIKILICSKKWTKIWFFHDVIAFLKLLFEAEKNIFKSTDVVLTLNCLTIKEVVWMNFDILEAWYG